MVGGALLGAAANRQVCPTISEMTFGNQSNPDISYVAPWGTPLSLAPRFSGAFGWLQTRNRFNGFNRVWETVETVSTPLDAHAPR